MIDWLRSWRRRRAIGSIIVDEEQWRHAESRLPFLGHLGRNDLLRLRELAREFIATKEWSGAGGLVLAADTQIAIALQACLLILNLGLDWYRGWVGIVVYPGDFIIPRHVVDIDGVVHEYDDEVLGEAWEGGPVVLSWPVPGTATTGINVVIHEFAHKLDMSNGEIDGMPALHGGMKSSAWRAAFEPAYRDFCQRVDRGEATDLDPYAAEHPAEFFAVMSEAFFETPELLWLEYPAVHGQLRDFYRQNPAGAVTN